MCLVCRHFPNTLLGESLLTGQKGVLQSRTQGFSELPLGLFSSLTSPELHLKMSTLLEFTSFLLFSQPVSWESHRQPLLRKAELFAILDTTPSDVPS